MNYLNQYELLINRAKNRGLSTYTEKHHIIPRCMGGGNNKSNIVRLTPEEHYVAHQLLIKIYPNEPKLVSAAFYMTCHQNGQRANNKIYGWLRKKYQKISKQRIGNKNPSFGKPWYHNPITLDKGKFTPGTEPNSWVRGRIPKFTICDCCGQSTNKSLAKWCDDCRTENIRANRPIVTKNTKTQREYTTEDKISALRKHNGNIRRALFELGLNDSGAHYRVMRQLKTLL